MHLNNGYANGADRIGYGYTGMGICPGIENNALRLTHTAMQVIDEFAFHIALIAVDLHQREPFGKLFEIMLKALMAVYFRLPCAEQVQVGAVYNCNVQHDNVQGKKNP